MIFNIGGSKSSSSSQSDAQSSSFDNLDASSFNFGANQSTSSGSSSSSSRIAFEDIFSKMFGGAAGAAAGIDTSALSGAANMLFGSGMGFLDNLSSGGAGTGFLESQLANSSGIVDEQIGQLSSDIGKFLTQTVMPGITTGGVSASTLGGSRGEVAQGLAAESALQEFARGSTAIRAGERDRLTGIAQGLSQDQISRTNAAMGFLPSLMGLAETGAMSSLSPFVALSQILGGPTVLTDSESSQLAESLGLDIGGSSQTGRAGSQSTSTSSSKSSSASFSLGFSDRRLKTDIKRIGTRKGYPWYSFNFVWGERGEGVMSDEVPSEFVSRHSSGFDVVDYQALLA